MTELLSEKCSVQELETQLQFQFLPQISFESKEDEEEIYLRGIDKEKKNTISPEALELGKKFKKDIEGSYLPPVSVRWIHEEVGYGLFAEKEIDEGSYAGEYTGIIRRNDRRYFEPLNNYCYEYPVPDEVGRSFVIDATQGHLTRFINHSDRPNLKPVYAYFNGYYHLIFLALQRIEKGDQLSYDYGKSYWYVRGRPRTL